MSEVIIPDDPRDAYQRMTRREIWRALKASNISFQAGISGPDGIKLLQANGIDPMEAIEWETVYVENEKHEKIPQQHPKRTQPDFSEADELKRNSEMERRLTEAAKNEASSKEEISDLKALIAQQSKAIEQLNTMIIGMKDGDVKVETITVEKGKKDLGSVHWKTFQKLAKGVGIDWNSKDPREPVIEKLEAHNVENAA